MFEKKNRQQVFFLLVGYISVKKKIIGNCNSVGAGAHKVEKVVSFEPTIDSSFPNIWR